jgi:nucleoporin NDC1
LLWDYYYSFGRSFISLAKTAKPTGLAPFAPLVAKFVVEGTLLVLLWEFANKAFDLYIAQEPLKNDKPITDDSKDPNGTLLNGLKAVKRAVKVWGPSSDMFLGIDRTAGYGILGACSDHRRFP